MSKNATGSVYGVDRAVVEAAMQRGRIERSRAFWAMLQAVFGRPEARDLPEVPAAGRAHC